MTVRLLEVSVESIEPAQSRWLMLDSTNEIASGYEPSRETAQAFRYDRRAARRFPVSDRMTIADSYLVVMLMWAGMKSKCRGGSPAISCG
jgi:hypothetical protein